MCKTGQVGINAPESLYLSETSQGQHRLSSYTGGSHRCATPPSATQQSRSSSRRSRLAFVALVAFIGVLLLNGGAQAFWSGGGSGTGTGGSGTVQAVTLSPGTISGGLQPGGQRDVVLTVSNPNLAEVSVRSLALDTSQGTNGYSVDAGHSGCNVNALSLATQTNGGAGWTIPKKIGAVNGTLSVTLTNALSMSAGASNACQGATFTVFVAAGP